MQSGILEQIRQLHADVEQHRAEIVKQLLLDPKNHRHRLLIDHFIAEKTETIADKSDQLLELYVDPDYQAAKDTPLTEQNALRNFEREVAQLKEYHRAHPQPPVTATFDEPSMDHTYVTFDTAEQYGRCLSLQEHYARYLTFHNASGLASAMDTAAAGSSTEVKKPLLRTVDTVLAYDEFIEKLPTLMATTPCARKVAGLTQYNDYIVQLLEYLEGFFKRVHPLLQSDITSMIATTKEEFAKAWEAGAVPGWDKGFVGNVKQCRRIALAEAFVERYLALMQDELKEAKKYHVNQLTKTVEEIEIEMNEQEEQLQADYTAAMKAFHQKRGTATTDASTGGGPSADVDGGESDDGEDNVRDAVKFNKKNFPLDRDGKPIPPWLYYIHGLHKKYHCDICGYTYYGERAYISHFTELRHVKGLQRLGIVENLPELRLVAKREDALQLWKKLRERAVGQRALSRPDDEEIEDVRGNVTTRGERGGWR